MTIKKGVANLLVMLGLVISTRLPDSALSAGLRYLAMAWICVDLVLQARAGYVSPSPLTSESWRRYFMACSIPAASFVVTAGMMVALEWRLPVVGTAGSTLRGVWAGVMMAFLVVGAVGLAAAIGWLSSGEASREFSLRGWFRRRRGQAA